VSTHDKRGFSGQSVGETSGHFGRLSIKRALSKGREIVGEARTGERLLSARETGQGGSSVRA